MVLKNSGFLKLSEIQTEFGGTDPISMSEYYRSGAYVPNISLNLSIPTGGTINIGDFYGSSVSTFSITPSATTVNEGDTVTFTINTSDFSGTLYWTVSTSSVTDADFSSPSNAVTSGGSVLIFENTGSVDLTLNEDSLTEGSEYFRLILRVNSTIGTQVAQSSLITVNDTSLTKTYDLTGPASVNEGSTLTIVLNTTNVPDGTTVDYTITGITSDDLSSGNLTGSFTVNSNTASVALGIAQEPSGGSTASKLFIGGSTENIRQYSLSDPINGSSIISSYDYNVNQKFITFNDDGTKVFYSGIDKIIHEDTLSTAYDITTVTGTTVTKTITETGDLGGGIFSNDGRKFFWCQADGRKVFQHGLSTGWDISTMNSNAAYEWSINLPLPGLYRGIEFGNNGQYLYLVSSQYNRVYMYQTASNYNIGPTLPSIISPGAIVLNTNTPRDLAFTNDGSRMYVSYDTKVEQYNLSTPWDLFTASYNSFFDVSSLETGTDGIFVKLEVVEGNEVLRLSLDNGEDFIDVTIVDIT